MPNTKVNGILRHREECGWENSNVAPPEVRESCLYQRKYFTRMDSPVFSISQRSPNRISTLIFKGSSAKILFKRRESLRRGDEVMIEIIWVGRRLAIEHRGSVLMQYLERRWLKDYETVL
jgi:hypothetical protein